MVLYNNDSCKSVSTLMLLVGLCVFAAASDGKTSPVEDGTLFFTHIFSSIFLVGQTASWCWGFLMMLKSMIVCSLCSKNKRWMHRGLYCLFLLSKMGYLQIRRRSLKLYNLHFVSRFPFQGFTSPLLLRIKICFPLCVCV